MIRNRLAFFGIWIRFPFQFETFNTKKGIATIFGSMLKIVSWDRFACIWQINQMSSKTEKNVMNQFVFESRHVFSFVCLIRCLFICEKWLARHESFWYCQDAYVTMLPLLVMAAVTNANVTRMIALNIGNSAEIHPKYVSSSMSSMTMKSATYSFLLRLFFNSSYVPFLQNISCKLFQIVYCDVI